MIEILSMLSERMYEKRRRMYLMWAAQSLGFLLWRGWCRRWLFQRSFHGEVFRWIYCACSVPPNSEAESKWLRFCYPVCYVTEWASTTAWWRLDFSSICFCYWPLFGVEALRSSYSAALLWSSVCLSKFSFSFCASHAVRWICSSVTCVFFSSVRLCIRFIEPKMSSVIFRNIVNLSVATSWRWTSDKDALGTTQSSVSSLLQI